MCFFSLARYEFSPKPQNSIQYISLRAKISLPSWIYFQIKNVSLKVILCAPCGLLHEGSKRKKIFRLTNKHKLLF